MKTILAAAIAVLAIGCDYGCDYGAKQKATDRCQRDCPTYGASFVRVTCPGSYCSEYVERWECWCRRGAESGVGSEPLRIW